MSKLCFMFGHRDTPAAILPEIERAVEKYYLEYGFDEFVVGYHGSFDRMAAQAVRSVQKNHPSIRLALLLAYHPSGQNHDLLAAYDSTLYPDGMERVPRRLAILSANHYMIGRADGFICYVHHTGNTLELLKKAEKRAAAQKIPFVNLGASSMQST